MKRQMHLVVSLVLLLTLFAQPVAAAENNQGTGGVFFGSYTVASGNRITEDVVVFGGPVRVENEAVVAADLTVFGPVTIEDGGYVDGQLVVLGTLDMDGTVDGDVFCAGAVSLGSEAYIYGDLDAAGTISQSEGSVVEGDIASVDEGDFNWDIPFTAPDNPVVVNPTTPTWVRWVTNVFKAIAGVVIMTLVALLIASIWPEQMQRVAMTIEEAPLPTFGVGLLSLIVSGIVLVLLIITICLSLLGIVGMILVGLALLVGWVALGYIVGQRFMRAVVPQAKPNTVIDAVLGTALISFLVAISGVFGPLKVLLQIVFLPIAAGAVVLTRFGTRPYLARGGTPGVVMPVNDLDRSEAPVPSVFVAPDVTSEQPAPEPVAPEPVDVPPVDQDWDLPPLPEAPEADEPVEE